MDIAHLRDDLLAGRLVSKMAPWVYVVISRRNIQGRYMTCRADPGIPALFAATQWQTPRIAKAGPHIRMGVGVRKNLKDTPVSVRV